MEEKRRYTRLELPLDVDYNPLDSKGLKQKAKAKDISESGISLFLDKQQGLTPELALKINLPGEYEPLFIQGKIAWSKELSDKNLVGIKFREISRFDRSRIISLIQAKKGKEIVGLHERDIFILKEIILEDKKELLDMLVERFQDIEEGLRCIDKNAELSNDMEKIDILGADLKGQLVIIEVAIEADEGMLWLALRHFNWILGNRDLLKKLYPYGVDFNQKPRVFLMAREFSDSFQQQPLNIQPANIQTIEYKCFLTPENRKGLWLNKTKEFQEAQEAQPVLKEPPSEIKEPAPLSLLEIAEFDEQRKRIVNWLWRKK